MKTSPASESREPAITRKASLLDSWIGFWFAPSDPIVLGLVRIVAGLVLVYVLGATTFLLPSFYGANGWYDLKTADLLRKETPWVNPSFGWDDNDPTRPMKIQRPNLSDPDNVIDYRHRWRMNPSMASTDGLALFSLWFHVTDPTAMAIVHGIILLIAVLFTLGVWTRVTSVLAWLGFLNYVHRTPIASFGMDTMMALLLLYLMIGPSGAALSVDRWLARWWARRHGWTEPANPAPSTSATFAIRLLQVHFCLIYLGSGLSKLQGAAWWNGTALWQTSTNYEFSGAPVWFVHAGLVFLAQHRWLWEIALQAAALYTLFVEISLPYLIWIRRWRPLMMVCSALLHTGIALSMGGLGSFSLAMLAILCAFTPPETVHWLVDQLSAGVVRLTGKTRAAGPAVPLGAPAAALSAAGRTAVRA
jgi:hypothetical protein